MRGILRKTVYRENNCSVKGDQASIVPCIETRRVNFCKVTAETSCEKVGKLFADPSILPTFLLHLTYDFTALVAHLYPETTSSMLPTRIVRRALGGSTIQPSALLKSRVARPTYLQKLRAAEDLVEAFKDGDYLGWSG